MRRNAVRALAAAPLILTAALAPGAASAATYCVPAVGAAACDGIVAASVADAVTRADDSRGPDTVAIGAGLHELGPGVTVMQPDTEVRGAGREQTILTVDPLEPDDGFTRTIVSGSMPRLSDLTLRLASAVLEDGNNGSVQGADVYDGVVERVRIDAEGAQFGPGINDGRGDALTLRNGAIRDVEVAFGAERDTEGVAVSGWWLGEAVEVDGLRVDAPRALYVGPGPLQPGETPVVRIRRSRLRGIGPLTVGSGLVEVRDAVVESLPRRAEWELDATAAVSLFNGYPRERSGLRLDRVTIVGSGGQQTGHAETFAFHVAGNEGDHPLALEARHVLVTGVDRTLLSSDWGGRASTVVTHSLLDARGGPQSVRVDPDGSGGGSATHELTLGVRGGDPRFVDAAAGDLRLAAGSPAVDVGGEELLAGEATDLAGAPRPTDGDADGAVAADAGAFEHQWVPPAPDDRRGGGDEQRGGGEERRHGPVCCARPPVRRPVLRALALSARRVALGARRRPVVRFRLVGSARLAVRFERRAGRRWVSAGTIDAGTAAFRVVRIPIRHRVAGRRLVPGTYRLRVVARNEAGAVVSRPLRLAVAARAARTGRG